MLKIHPDTFYLRLGINGKHFVLHSDEGTELVKTLARCRVHLVHEWTSDRTVEIREPVDRWFPELELIWGSDLSVFVEPTAAGAPAEPSAQEEPPVSFVRVEQRDGQPVFVPCDPADEGAGLVVTRRRLPVSPGSGSSGEN